MANRNNSEREIYPHGNRPWKPSDEATPMLVRAADRLFEECRRAMVAHRLDSRSPIVDALLDYREERDEAAAESAGAPKATVTKLPSQWAGSGRSPYA